MALAYNAVDDDLVVLDTDTVIVIRGGQANLRGPAHEELAEVPDDFVVALGVARAWGDENFRKMMRIVVREAMAGGELEGILSSERVQVQ